MAPFLELAVVDRVRTPIAKPAQPSRICLSPDSPGLLTMGSLNTGALPPPSEAMGSTVL